MSGTGNGDPAVAPCTGRIGAHWRDRPIGLDYPWPIRFDADGNIAAHYVRDDSTTWPENHHDNPCIDDDPLVRVLCWCERSVVRVKLSKVRAGETTYCETTLRCVEAQHTVMDAR